MIHHNFLKMKVIIANLDYSRVSAENHAIKSVSLKINEGVDSFYE